MDSMTNSRGVVVGVDAHTDTHDVAVLDDCGRLLARQTFAADAAGYRALREWIEPFAPIAAIGVESTGSYAAGLVRHMRAEGLEVVLEINQPHPHTRRRRGKSDPIDAELAARHVLAANRPVVAKDTSGIVEAIRQLRVARDGAVKARTAALNALNGLIITPGGSAPTADGAQDQARSREALRTPASRPATAPGARAGSQGRAAVAGTTHHRARRRDRAARPTARATRRRGRADHDQPRRGRHRARRHAAGDRRPEHRTSAPRGRVRRTLRRQPDPRLQRAHRSPPPQL